MIWPASTTKGCVTAQESWELHVLEQVDDELSVLESLLLLLLEESVSALLSILTRLERSLVHAPALDLILFIIRVCSPLDCGVSGISLRGRDLAASSNTSQ